MLNNHTVDALRGLRLTAMAEAYLRQMQDPTLQGLSFEERFGLLVDHEVTSRYNQRLGKLIREAKFKVQATPEEVDHRPARGLDSALIRHLTSGQWIAAHHNLVVTGPTGGGKTYLSCALETAACRLGFSVRYYRVSRLFQDITLSKADGSYSRLAAKLAKTDLLILDDWGLASISTSDGRELLDILDDRTSLKSTCIASQLPVEMWHSQFADPTVADAILDRLVHSSYKVNLQGESMRKLKSPLLENEESAI
ncbi:IS21-like element helper ATPase IstB [Alicyclobacillus fastidiosus]|uniref:IS21-like element helper ATPase IstB n=1 Tax=Alicyclobacillus fastidiosus TaxID=392011 RepID=A0ABY6ZGF6_9BACL|nr:IS21-like element helper ATPase IstB [Alicyclobacillus fastidiosus]WAH41978.1 IS21-like element helper ATPase IstB [Alicyclobacillus fastidiosus]GMA63710.1 ATPase AAA [Alicyclobacillus fastidiosus]